MIFLLISTFVVSGGISLYVLNGFLAYSGPIKKRNMAHFAVTVLGALSAAWGLYGSLGSPISPSYFSYNKSHNKEWANLKVLVAMLEDKCGSADCVSPKNASDHILLAQTYERLGQHKKSIAVYEKILQYMPEQRDVRRVLEEVSKN